MSEQAKSFLSSIIAPIIVGLLGGAFTGYMGAYTAIAVLEERVEKLETRQTTIKQQQEVDGRSLTRIETKVDLLLARTAQ
jgi:H+/gluconate symporter-like permease